MIKLRSAGWLVLCALLVAVPVAAQAASPSKAKAKSSKSAAAAPAESGAPAGVLARVGNEVITDKEVEEILERMSPQQRPPDAKRRVLDNIIELYVFAGEAKKAGLDKDPAVQKRLREVTTVVMARSFYDKYLTGRAVVSDEAARKVYDQKKDNYLAPPQVKVEHILVKDKAKAEEIIAQLKKGANFEELAKKESKDPMSAAKGGDLGWQSVSTFDHEFEKAVLALKKGETTPEPVRTRFGYHIIKLNDTRDKRIMSFDEVKGAIKDTLKQQEVDRLRKEYRAKANVHVYMKDEPAPKEANEDEMEPVEVQGGQSAPQAMPPGHPMPAGQPALPAGHPQIK